MADNAVAYGFIGLQQMWADRVTTVGAQTISQAIADSLAEYNQSVNALMSDLVAPTTDRTRRYIIPGGGDLQPIDEYGNPLPVRSVGSYDVGFPIQGGATAWGTNRVSRSLLTVEEANRLTVEAMKMDKRWLRRHVLAALLDNTTWTFADPAGDVTVQPLANNDSVKYGDTSGDTAVANHYTAGTAAVSTDLIATLRDKLLSYPQNTGDVILYIPSNLVASFEGLTGFVALPDRDITVGSGTATLNGSISPGFGDLVLGKVERCWIVEWRFLPDNYIIARIGSRPILAMRQYPAADLQGFFSEMHSPDGNLLETRMIRYAGFGVQDRTAAAVHLVGTASYEIPTGFATPLPQ